MLFLKCIDLTHLFVLSDSHITFFVTLLIPPVEGEGRRGREERKGKGGRRKGRSAAGTGLGLGSVVSR